MSWSASRSAFDRYGPTMGANSRPGSTGTSRTWGSSTPTSSRARHVSTARSSDLTEPTQPSSTSSSHTRMTLTLGRSSRSGSVSTTWRGLTVLTRARHLTKSFANDYPDLTSARRTPAWHASFLVLGLCTNCEVLGRFDAVYAAFIR